MTRLDALGDENSAEQVMLSLIEKLDGLAAGMSEEEQLLLRKMIDLTMDPQSRLQAREGAEVFAPDELAFLSELESGSPPPVARRSEQGQNGLVTLRTRHSQK